MKLTDLKPWHYAAGAAGLTVFGVGVWYFVYRLTEHETPPEETTMPPDPVAAGTVTGYIKGVPSQITVNDVGNGQVMRSDAAAAFLLMQKAAKAAGINLTATSGFRTNESQQRLYAGYVAKTPGFNLAAKPGWSNHQGGISCDVGGVGSFTSAAYQWLTMNAGLYGFKNDVRTEYWHWTFTPGTTMLSGLSGLRR